MSMFSVFQKDKIRIIKKDNAYTSPEIKALVEQHTIHIHASDLPKNIFPEDGDSIERTLPNDRTETFVITNSGYQPKWNVFPERYECKVKKIILAATEQPPTITYNINGNNARVYNHSTDHSINTVNPVSENIFAELKNIILHQLDADATLLKLVEEMEQNKDKSTFIHYYREFISTAADHVSILSPFIPALTQLIS